MSENGEKLRPESGPRNRRFVVKIAEVFDHDEHYQQWQQINLKEDGKTPHFGYLTQCKKVETEKVIFRGEFTERPQISALAALMERPAGGGAS